MIGAAVLALCAGHAAAVAPFVVKDIRVEGIQRTEAGTVFSYLPVRVGETFDDEKGTAAIKALYATGFFKDIRLEEENGVLVVLVEERPAIAAVDFTFLPNEPIIKPNTVVRWTNNSPFFQHTSTRTGTWDSGVFDPGQFFDRNFPAAEAGLSFDYVCTLHFGMEGFVNVTNFGDANLDGLVNLSDFNVLAANFGQTNRTWEQGDFNEDGTVNLNDFNLLAANFGREIEPASLTINIDFGAAVPEPMGAAGMLLLPALSMRARKRK